VVTSGLIETLLGELSQRREDFPRAAFSGLTQRLDNAGSGAIPGFTALETYADAAVAGYRGGGTLLRVGPAVQWRPDRKRRAGLPGSAISAVPWGAEGPQLAWHDETLIVVRVGGSAELVLGLPRRTKRSPHRA
jgi:hypothetical protein